MMRAELTNNRTAGIDT